MTAAGGLGWRLVLGAVSHIVGVLSHCKDWSHSVSRMGIADGQRQMSAQTIGKLLIETTALAVGRALPTLFDLTHISPVAPPSLFMSYFSQWSVVSEDSLQRTFM